MSTNTVIGRVEQAPSVKRTILDVIKTLLTGKAYLALLRILTNFTNPISVLVRYCFGTGGYPYVIRMETPIGIRQVNMSSFHDVRSLVGCFGKEDYFADKDISCAVDFGANIGMSGLYFLTRNARVRTYLFEPLPENVERLVANLRGLEARYEIQKTAIALRDGSATFLCEPTGRYGGIEGTIDDHEGVPRPYSITVKTREANAVLDEILAREGYIDILKLNIEGMEVPVLKSLRPDILDRIGHICAEIFDFPEGLPGFHCRKYGRNITWFENKRPRVRAAKIRAEDAETL
jgi:FkbM family methyltransferase